MLRVEVSIPHPHEVVLFVGDTAVISHAKCHQCQVLVCDACCACPYQDFDEGFCGSSCISWFNNGVRTCIDKDLSHMKTQQPSKEQDIA